MKALFYFLRGPLFIFSLLLSRSFCYAQEVRQSRDLAIQRLQLKIIGSFLFGVNQGQIDIDSAVSLACEGERLSHTLFYDEIYDDGSHLPGKNLIEQGNVKDAISLINRLSGIERIKLLLQVGSYYLYKTGELKADMDLSYSLLLKAKHTSDSLGKNNSKI